VAVIVECLSDNRNRTGSEVRSTFTRNGGSMAEPGAVSWQFQRQGVLMVPKSASPEDEVMLVALEAGADDLSDEGDLWQVTTPPADLAAVRAALEEAGITVDSADLALTPTTVVPIDDEGEARRVLRLIDLLEDHDDVQNVYANFDIPDHVIELVEA
jgi:YebC/PmpR family DNA-binding regulatory protein